MSAKGVFPHVGFCTEGAYNLYGPPEAGPPGIETHRTIVGALAAVGYDRFELVAPTLSRSPEQLTQNECRPYVEAAAAVGGKISGLHWLLAGTNADLTSPEPQVQKRTIEHIVRLAHLASWLGGTVNVHGSPAQRNLHWNQTYPEAFEIAASVYAAVLPRIRDLGVKICIEQLAPNETNFLGSLAEVVRFIDAVNAKVGENLRILHPIIDIKALLFIPGVTVDNVVAAIQHYGPLAAHVHLNNKTLGGPGCDELNFGPILQALYDIGYHEPWGATGEPRTLSVEVFNAKTVPLLETAKTSFATISQWRPA